jgi:hypothetical protein
MNIASLAFILIFITSCASTTIIRTQTDGAKIFIDNQFVGEQSAVYTDRKIAFKESDLRIEKDGCKTQTYTLQKSDQIDYLALVGGILMVVPTLWIMKYDPVTYVPYKCHEV